MRYLILLILFGLLAVSCDNEVGNSKKETPCESEGIYCKDNSIYSCHNDKDGNAVEEVFESCGKRTCENKECVDNECTETNCIYGERKCSDDGKSYQICGNYNEDSCFELKTEECGSGLTCNNGFCVPDDEEDPCDSQCDTEWQECNIDIGVCEPKSGFCASSDDCTGTETCNSNHKCESGCISTTCAGEGIGADCGMIDDGCGDKLDCGTCVTGTCNDSTNKCEAECTPTTCATEGAECGEIDNGCGSILQCHQCQQAYTCEDNKCVSPCDSNPCTETNKTVCGVTGTGYTCSCVEGYHLDNAACVLDGNCFNVDCGTDKHCDETDGSCAENSDWVECTSVTPEHGIVIVEQVEVTWSDEDGWSTPANCDWECDEGYTESEDGSACVAITCNNDQHLEENECTDNSQDVLCTPSTDHPDDHYSDIQTFVTINWTEADGWETAAECEWECDEDFHLFEDIDTNFISCISNTNENVSCESNGNDLPENAIEDTSELVTQTWIVDSNVAEGGYWLTPKCSWTCDAGSCLSSDGLSCLTEDDDVCDGEDNNCDGIIDNKENSTTANSSCGDANCFGKIYDEHRYMFCSNKKDWDDSSSYCTSKGGYLVSINDNNENTFITNNISENHWIGYYQNGNSDDDPWFWTDGSGDTHTSWDDGQPSNSCTSRVCMNGNGSYENNAEIRANGKWNDEDEDSNRRFICEFAE